MVTHLYKQCKISHTSLKQSSTPGAREYFSFSLPLTEPQLNRRASAQVQGQKQSSSAQALWVAFPAPGLTIPHLSLPWVAFFLQHLTLGFTHLFAIGSSFPESFGLS